MGWPAYQPTQVDSVFSELVWKLLAIDCSKRILMFQTFVDASVLRFFSFLFGFAVFVFKLRGTKRKT